jgi:two-component system cell cycle sensor histidine kinase/response regulator CckA
MAPLRPLILVVDDEPSVRRLIARTLVRAGYEVLEAGDGQAALAALAGHPHPVHLILTDVVMPVMDGARLGLEVAQRYSDLPVLYMSAHVPEEISGEWPQADERLLAKPFAPAELLALVGQYCRRDDSAV